MFGTPPSSENGQLGTQRGAKRLSELQPRIQKKNEELTTNNTTLSSIQAKHQALLREQRQKELEKERMRLEQQVQLGEYIPKPRNMISQLIQVQTTTPPRTNSGERLNLAGSQVLQFGVGEISELCGEPGTGKTNIALNAVAACLRSTDQLGPTAIVIDTEGSFDPLRILEMGDLESRLHYFRVHTMSQLACLILYHLPLEFLPQNPRVKLIVIDGIAFHFRNSFSEGASSHKLLKSIGHVLQHMAEGEFTQGAQTCILVTNQVTKGPGGAMNIARPQLDEDLYVCLGDTWTNYVDYRVRTRKMDTIWEVSVVKGRLHNRQNFQITDVGIRMI